MNVEPLGTQHLPPSNQLDIRFEKTFRMVKGQRLAVRANAFNFLNSNAVLNVTRLSGPNFNRPTDVMAPRIWEFSTTYSF